MLIEISTLPPIIQEQILQIQQGETIQFANHGQIIGELVQNNDTTDSDSLMATFGLWQNDSIDGLAYERKLRSEWDREWQPRL